MVSFLFYYSNARASHIIYLATLLTLTTYYPFASVFLLTLLDSLWGYFEWQKEFQQLSVLEFVVTWELRKESQNYKVNNVLLHFLVLLPYFVLWLLSYGQSCIGIAVLAYAIFVFAMTVNVIYNYDGPAHKGLKPKLAPKLNLTVSPTDHTDFVLTTLYSITYLTYEEEKEGNEWKQVDFFATNQKYTHLAWRLVKNLQPEEMKQLRDYLLFSDDAKLK